MNTNVLSAIFRRNFVAYFSSPTGYVFIALFMFFSSLAAFGPVEFFNANLANLDQLNKYFLWLMLGFVPSITMSIWADERRQGTDELLLTIPANDFEVVAGKYLAAVSIYAVALAFSALSNWIALISMGDPDIGLFLANYVGYWFVGLAMIALGMIGSFLTGNLTVSFVLGFICIFPFVITQLAESFVPWREGVDFAKQWTFVGPFEDFTRGVISLSSVTYFVAVAAFALYVCMILIGRRHWLGGRDGSSLIGHYVVRGLAFVAIAASIVFVFTNHDVIRADATVAKLNSLSQDTKDLLEDLHVEEAREIKKRRETLTKELADAKQAAEAKKNDKESQKAVEKAQQRLRQVDLDEARIDEPIVIDAYISREVPEAYVAKRLDLISKLREFEHLAKGKLAVKIYDIEPLSIVADQAKDSHGLEARRINFETRGQLLSDEIFLGASIRSGLDEVVIKFFELGIPVEYELIQAIVTVSQSERKTLGVIKTDANLMGGISFAGGMPQMAEQQPIVGELMKHYKVIEVDPSDKIVDPDDPNAQKYDVLLVAQPSALSPPQLANVRDAVMAGTPTAIFEDPFPLWMQEVPGTDQPKRPRQQMMGMPQPPEEKGDIRTLFAPLGVELVSQKRDQEDQDFAAMSRGRPTDREAVVIWQRYNPYPALRFSQGLTNEWVFVNDIAPKTKDADGKGCFSDDPVTSGLYELLFVFPGGINQPAQQEVERWTRDVEDLTKRAAEKPGDETIKHNLELARNSLERAKDRRAKLPGFTSLVRTGEESGTIRYRHIEEAFRNRTPFAMREHEEETGVRQCLAARIQGEIDAPPAHANADDADADDADADAKNAGKNKAKTDGKTKVNVVLVSDVDLFHEVFFGLRANPDRGLNFQFQNVPFVLNIIDSLVDDKRFLDIRKGRQMYGHLTHVERRIEDVVTSKIEQQIDEAEEKFKQIEEDAKKEREQAVKDAQKKLEDMQKKEDGAALNLSVVQRLEDQMNMTRQMATAQEDLKKLRADKELRTERNKAVKEGKRRTYALNDTYKAFALLLPPIVPFVVGVAVFFYRRSREEEGAATSRLR
ncbi:MAG: Gldg family protein [Pirellulales bacterium]